MNDHVIEERLFVGAANSRSFRDAPALKKGYRRTIASTEFIRGEAPLPQLYPGLFGAQNNHD